MAGLKLPRGRFFGRAQARREVGGLVLVESHHPAGSRLPRHSHEHAYFCLNLGGDYTESFGRRRRECHEGMLVFHPAGECHAQEHHGDVASLNVELGDTWLRRIEELVAPLDQPSEFRGDDVAAAGAQILCELRRDDRDSALAIEGLVLEILAASARREPTMDGRAPLWLRDARELLDAPGDGASLRDLAAQAGVHPVHFAATFRRFLGCSLGEYQRRRRFEHARARLADRTATLAVIAVEAGFADQSHLTRTFKRFSGMTPGEYRAMLGLETRR